MEYLGFWVIRGVLKPTHRKIEAITNIKTPTSLKEVREFIVVVK